MSHTKPPQEKVLSAVAWSAVEKIGGQLGYIVATIYLAKQIGPEAFGLIGLLSVFVVLFDTTLNTGFSQALVQRGKSLTAEQASTVFYVAPTIAFAVYALLYLSAPSIATFFNEAELVGVARVLFLAIIPSALSLVHRAELLRSLNFQKMATAAVIATLAGFASSTYLAKAGYGYWSFVCLILVRSITLSAGFVLLSNWSPARRFSIERTREVFLFWTHLTLASVVAAVSNALYTILIGRHLGIASVGHFTQASNLTSYLSGFIASVLQSSMFPILSSLRNEHEKFVSLFKESTRYAMLISFPALLGLAAISDTFVMLFLGEAWTPVIAPLQLLCVARAITPISVINLNALNAAGRSDLFLKIELAKIPLTLTALLIATPMGIQAVAWAILTTTWISFAMNAYFPKKLFEFGPLEQLMVGKNYIVCSVAFLIVIRFIEINSLWLDLLVSIFAGISIYFGLLLLLKDEGVVVVSRKIEVILKSQSDHLT